MSVNNEPVTNRMTTTFDDLVECLERVGIKQISYGSRTSEDTTITSLTSDSREVIRDSMFVCISGFNSDGHDYINDVDSRGAAAIVVEHMPEHPVGATLIQVEDTRLALAYLSAAWFGNPADDMVMIGLTGTKGKTTTTHMIKYILEAAGHKTGIIGTIGAFCGEEKIPTNNTTPGAYELHGILAKMRDAGCSHVVMEVSSQGLKQHRTAGINFKYGAFLNISPDHISASEHANFEEYFACKKMLFPQCETSVVNIDADRADEILDIANDVVTFSTIQSSDYRAMNISNVWGPGVLGISFSLAGRSGEHFRLNMPGVYNVENALAAISITHSEGIDFATISAALADVRVKGRTQIIRNTDGRSMFIIDYAHNAMSLECLLEMVNSYSPERILCLFGGGGNRSHQRYHDMGEVSGRYADLTIVTTDNSRDDDVNDINNGIISGLNEHNGKYKVIVDRREAIHYLVDHCRAGDIAIIAGKGHEEYQEIRGVRRFFSDEKVLREYLEEKAMEQEDISVR